MKRQALILEVRHNAVIVLTEDHDYLKIRIQPGYAVGQSIQVLPEDLLSSHTFREEFKMKKNWLTIAASLVLVIAIGAFAATVLPGLGSDSTESATAQLQTTASELPTTAALSAKPAVAVLAIDINPSIELLLDEDGVVVSYEAMNDDAEKLLLDGIIGLPAAEAVEKVIAAAEAAGFIDSDDAAADYVVVALAPLDDDDDDFEPLYLRLQERLQERIELNEGLQSMEMVMLQTTAQVRLQAHQDEIGLGLQVMNQAAVKAGLDEAKTVREYFANQERLELAQQEGYLWQGQYGGSEEGPGQGAQEQNRETTGTANSSETQGTGTGTGAGNGKQGETAGGGNQPG